MRFQVVDVRAASQALEGPFQLCLLTDVDEYGCYLYRCEGEMPLHRHPDHDELFWPLDGTLLLRGSQGEHEVPRGHLARVPRGWQHGSTSRVPIHVLLLTRGPRGLTLNGHPAPPVALPPQRAEPLAALAERGANAAVPLLRCDALHVHAEQVEGSGPAREATCDVLLAPLRGTVGLRCGGLVLTLGEWQMARIPAGTGWHLFGSAPVLWMSKERAA